MTIQADVDAQVTIDATTSAAAIAAATNAVSGYAFSIAGITVAATDFVSTDAVITELAIGAVHRHQDNLKFQGIDQIEFNPQIKLNQVQRDIVSRTVKMNRVGTLMRSSTDSPSSKGKVWSSPDF